MTEINPIDSSEKTGQPPELVQQAENGRQAWRRFGLQLRTITPKQFARFGLVAGTFIAISWLLVRSWPALIPFLVGIVLAYALLPVVNGLDRLMPRTVAALLSMLTIIVLLALFIALLIPALVSQYERVAAILPDKEQVQTLVSDLDRSLENLPAPVRETVVNSLDQIAANSRARLDEATRHLPDLIVRVLLQAINIIGAILGLLVLPTWLLIILSEQRKGSEAFYRFLPDKIRDDLWAGIRILDRSFRAFFQKQVTQGLLTGFFMFVAASALTALGLIEVEYPLLIALFAGLMELIPEIGPIIVIVVVGLAGLLTSPATAVIYIFPYLIIHRLVGSYVEGRAGRKVREVHPAVLVVAVVALSELGLFWLLLSVPIVTTFRDLFRYANSRLREPASPAGLIPDEVRPTMAAGEARPAATQNLPLAYRRNRAARSSDVSPNSPS